MPAHQLLLRRLLKPRRGLLALAGVLLSTVALAGATRTFAASPAANPFLGAKLYVDPSSDVARQVSAWQATRPADAQQLEKIASQPWTDWLGDWLPDVHQYVNWYIDTNLRPNAASAFFAVYDLPRRDCSGVFSAGGAAGASAYRAWIDQVASAIGSYPAIIVVEPDGVPDSACLGAAGQAQRMSLERYATQTLAGLAHTSVYVDAGRDDWRPAREMARLLRAAGVGYARGFSLDVTGYDSTRAELAYGDAISRALHGAHFIVNTSRNGRGPLPRSQTRSLQETWCNTPGRALGPRPTTHTGDPRADAFEWVLHPGYSDGLCQGGAKAGTWWPQYALGLAQRAAY